jgi:hypothetical protein
LRHFGFLIGAKTAHWGNLSYCLQSFKKKANPLFFILLAQFCLAANSNNTFVPEFSSWEETHKTGYPHY